MRTSLRHVVLVALAVAAIVNVVRAGWKAPPPPPVPVLQQLAASVDKQYHECVPLGWFPDSRPWRGYVPGFNANLADRGVLFEALWAGVIPARMLGDRRAAAVKSVLDELTGLGLLTRRELRGEFRYSLTREGQRYYYEENRLGNNVEAWPYLCFSRLHVAHVAWASRAAMSAGPHGVLAARVRFTWEPGEAAPWATPFVRAHAVVLDPTSSPAEATAFRRFDGSWGLAQVDFAFPLVEDRTAWSGTVQTTR